MVGVPSEFAAVTTCQGETLDECEFNGAEVLSLILEEYIESGREIPLPTQRVKGAHYLLFHLPIKTPIIMSPTPIEVTHGKIGTRA